MNIKSFFKKSDQNNDIKLIEEKIRNNIIKENKLIKEDIDIKIVTEDILDKIINEFILNKPNFINSVERGIISKTELKQEIYNFINIKAEFLNEKDKEDLLKKFETYIWGYGELQDLIDNNNITDIKIIDENNIRIKENGRRRQSGIRFRNKEALKQYVNYIAIKNGVTLSEISAIQKATDKTSSEKFILRINISSEFVNTGDTPYLHIRKVPKFKFSLEDLKEKKMFNEEIFNYWNEAMKAGLSIFATGKGASGKTTLINALLDNVPIDKSGLIIQESEELHSNHPDMMFQKVRISKGESKINYTLKELAINGLLTDIDVFGIGEIKGDEAIDMINATFTGATGLGTVHGNSAKEAIDKLVHYMKNTSDMQKGELLRMLASLDIISFMKDFKCFEIVEIAGFDEEKEKLIFNEVFEYKIKEIDGKFIGEFVKLNDSCEKIIKKKRYSEFIKNN